LIIFIKVLKKVLLLSKGVSDKLQSEDLDVVTGCERVADLLSTVQALRCEPKFEEFWETTVTKCRSLNIEEPRQERTHKLPRRIDDNPDTAVHLTSKDKFRISFYYNVGYMNNELFWKHAFQSLIKIFTAMYFSKSRYLILWLAPLKVDLTRITHQF
jgi:hypothetical protein